jgi:hypothetical protein
LKTPRGLKLLLGVVSRFGRIETLKWGEAEGRNVARRENPRWSKHKRGERKPNDRAGVPRRGERSREHRLVRVPNGYRTKTDSRPEQSSEVIGE